MLLMFGAGLHFSLADLLAVKRIALPDAVVQMTVATLLGMLLAYGWGDIEQGWGFLWICCLPKDSVWCWPAHWFQLLLIR
jgi:predicted Kef-type K+ transport protein